jgi:glycerol-3-phosphate acyltransferase PlsX
MNGLEDLPLKIAVDIMGADLEPSVLLAGIQDAAKEWPTLELLAVGDEKQITPYIDGKIKNITVVHAEDIIGPNDDPASAAKRKLQSSMVIAARLVRDQSADAMISAGNTGGLVSAGALHIKRIPGVIRPALAPMIPTVDNIGLLALDLGANMDCKAEQLLQFAIMGSIYREKIHDLPNPRVGLLNVGTEDGKGNALTKAAHELLIQAPINYIGNVEARDVLQRNCDVLVCDGFVGNVLLKAMEGTANTMFQIIRDELSHSVWTKLLALPLRNRLRGIKDKYNYKSTGGGVLLGVNGLCLKAHGSSDAFAIKNAILQAKKAHENRLIEVIQDELSKLSINVARSE